MEKTDNIFASPIANLGDFRFDQQVAEVFPDMIKRSVPGYSNIVSTIGLLTRRFAQKDTTLYDLGCSLGAATHEMRRNLTVDGCQIVAVDNSEAMLERCRLHLGTYKNSTPVTLECADICSLPMSNASMVILNFTLQFIKPHERDALIKKIFDALRPGGMLLLSEKLRFEDPAIQDVLGEMHLDFKRANGYSELEISQKRAAIEDVLVPETLEQHKARLGNAGFQSAEQWFQCFNFASLLAIKTN